MPAAVRCPKCHAQVTLPDRPVSKTCCPRCKTFFPVGVAAPTSTKEAVRQPRPRPAAPAANPAPPSTPAEPVRLACPECGTALQVKGEVVGQKTRCPACKAVFVAEPENEEPASVAPSRQDKRSNRPQVPTEYGEREGRARIRVSTKRYSEETLMPGEEVVYSGERHWIVFVPAVLIIPLFCILWLTLTPALEGSVRIGVFILLLGLALLGLVGTWFKKMTSEFTVTNKRVLIKQGFISRKTLEMNLAKIENLQIDQSIFGRLLDYGTVTVVGTGGTRERFANLAEPLEMRRAIQHQSFG